MNDSKSRRAAIMKVALAVVLVVVGFVSMVNRLTTCVWDGCNEQKRQGSDYCRVHNSEVESWYREDSWEPSTRKEYKITITLPPSNSDTKPNAGSSTKPSNKRPGTTVYNEYFHDPADYDTPEDFADDAWGVDFEDWDEAYDYWEDY